MYPHRKDRSEKASLCAICVPWMPIIVARQSPRPRLVMVVHSELRRCSVVVNAARTFLNLKGVEGSNPDVISERSPSLSLSLSCSLSTVPFTTISFYAGWYVAHDALYTADPVNKLIARQDRGRCCVSDSGGYQCTCLTRLIVGAPYLVLHGLSAHGCGGGVNPEASGRD
jgi:hypothetical protein